MIWNTFPKLGALCLLASQMFAIDTANAGGSAPATWKPTKHYRISFAYNPEVTMRSHGGVRVVCPDGFQYKCVTPQRYAQESVDYLNVALRASGANIKAVVAGTAILDANVRHNDAFDYGETIVPIDGVRPPKRVGATPRLEDQRRNQGGHVLMVVNRTRWQGHLRGKAHPTIGWFVAGHRFQEESPLRSRLVDQQPQHADDVRAWQDAGSFLGSRAVAWRT